MFIAVSRKSFLQHFLLVVFVAFALRDYTLELYLLSLLAPKFSTVHLVKLQLQTLTLCSVEYHVSCILSLSLFFFIYIFIFS